MPDYKEVKNMKKSFAIVLAIFMIVSVGLIFTGCNSNSIKQFLSGKEPSSIEDYANGNDTGLDGGWTKSESPEITDEFMAVFEKATETLTGMKYKPVAYIASQVVAGTNHLVLCRATATVPGAATYYALVYIYESLQGDAEITRYETAEVKAAAERVAEPGGWGVPESPVIPKDIMKDIEKATSEITGASYTPIAIVESLHAFSDSVSYRVLCEVTPVVPDAVSEYKIVLITVDDKNNARILETNDFLTPTQENAETPNPVVGYQTLENAEKAVGFGIEYKGIDKVINYATIGDEILEISFKGGYLRKAKGTDDISGDYNEYATVTKVNVNGKTVALKGNDKLFRLAVWTDDGYSYCLGFDEGTTETEITNLINSIK